MERFTFELCAVTKDRLISAGRGGGGYIFFNLLRVLDFK